MEENNANISRVPKHVVIGVSLIAIGVIGSGIFVSQFYKKYVAISSYNSKAANTTCVPRPACLDSERPCKIAEPAEGWCPASPSPTPTCQPRPACLDVKPPGMRCFLPETNPSQWCPVTPTPTPTCIERPACLDAERPCKIAEPADGWCRPTPIPTPTCIERPACLDSERPCRIAEPADGWCRPTPTPTPFTCFPGSVNPNCPPPPPTPVRDPISTLTIVSPRNGEIFREGNLMVSYRKLIGITGGNHVHFQLDNNTEVRDLDFDGTYTFVNVPAGNHILKGYLARVDHSKVTGTDVQVLFSMISDTLPVTPFPTPFDCFPGSANPNCPQPTPSPTYTPTSVPLTITTNLLPSADLNNPYQTTIIATGGKESYVWKIAAGSLPPGLLLNQTVCITSPCQIPTSIYGKPTKAGTYTFWISVASGQQVAKKQFNLLVGPLMQPTSTPIDCFPGSVNPDCPQPTTTFTTVPTRIVTPTPKPQSNFFTRVLRFFFIGRF